MRITQSIKGVALATVLLLASLAAAQPADVLGWGKTRWGMTRAQVEKLFPGNNWKQINKDRPWFEMVEWIEVAGKECSVTAHYNDSSPHGLSFVKLSFWNVATEEMLTQLTEKYGPPKHVEPVVPGGWQERNWTFKHTAISLSSGVQKLGIPSADVIYRATQPTRAKGDL